MEEEQRLWERQGGRAERLKKRKRGVEEGREIKSNWGSGIMCVINRYRTVFNIIGTVYYLNLSNNSCAFELEWFCSAKRTKATPPLDSSSLREKVVR